MQHEIFMYAFPSLYITVVCKAIIITYISTEHKQTKVGVDKLN